MHKYDLYPISGSSNSTSFTYAPARQRAVEGVEPWQPQPRILEGSNTLDGKWALTIAWPGGEETVEEVSDELEAFLSRTLPSERADVSPRRDAFNIECHSGRDILDTLREVADRLPPSPALSVIAGAIQEIDALRADVSPRRGMGEALGYAERLAVALWELHWRDESPDWKPLSGDLVGILTQINNMTADLRRLAAPPPNPAAAPGEARVTEEMAYSPIGYQALFNAIAASVDLPKGTHYGISVKAFWDALPESVRAALAVQPAPDTLDRVALDIRMHEMKERVGGVYDHDFDAYRGATYRSYTQVAIGKLGIWTVAGPKDVAEQLVAAIRALPSASTMAQSGWLPIESAPQDGTFVLLFWPEIDGDPDAGMRSYPAIDIGCWCRPESWLVPHWARNGRWTPAYNPTHWQPLPEGPRS